MDINIVFEFLIDLKFNNNRAWFKENKARYEKAKLEFEKFIELLIPKIKEIDNQIDILPAKDCIFRIYKDIRFSKNKDPYKTNFGASISKGGRKSINASYYIHLEPDNSFIGGGIYKPDSKVLKAIRTTIFENPEQYKNIINKTNFKKYFPEIYGKKLKIAPKGFPKNFKHIALLNNKHYAVIYNIENSFWFKDNLTNNISTVFKVQKEFIHFLNKIVENNNK